MKHLFKKKSWSYNNINDEKDVKCSVMEMTISSDKKEYLNNLNSTTMRKSLHNMENSNITYLYKYDQKEL